MDAQTTSVIASVVSGGGTLAFAVAVWMQLRDQTRELRGIRHRLTQLLTLSGVVDDDSGDRERPSFTGRRAPARGVPIVRTEGDPT